MPKSNGDQTMVRSEMRQGVHTIYEPDIHRMKQIDYHTEDQVRFSRNTYDTEADAWAAFDRQEVRFGNWYAAGTKTPPNR
jgi:hypothetical protein